MLDDGPARGGREQKRLIDIESFYASALIVAERIEVKALNHLPEVAESPLTVRLPGGGVASLFRYGAVAFFTEEPGDRDWLMASLALHCMGRGDPATILNLDAFPSLSCVSCRAAFRRSPNIFSTVLEEVQAILIFFESIGGNNYNINRSGNFGAVLIQIYSDLIIS